MAENRKIIIEVVARTSGAEKNLNKVGTETEKTGNKAQKASKSFLGLGKTFTAIARGFVIVKSFQLLARGISDSIRTAAEFESTMAKVKAITGATDDEFNKLEKSARELALGTIFTAQQVGELQLAYSKLGFTTQEILNATEATLDLATATGEDLASAADVVGATIRGFGLDASETTRVVDVMTKSFSSSALNLEGFKQSMKTVAPIAASANVSLETTTALLGTLADAGLRGTRAATGLRNLMSQLTDPTSKLAQELGYTIENSEGLIHAFKDLATRNIDLAKATGLTDKRSKAAFITLVNGIDNVQDLEFALDNASGSALRMSSIVGDTLIGSYKRFQSQIQETQIALVNNAIFRGLVDDASIILAFYSQGVEKARQLRAEIEAEPFIKEDFEQILKEEKKFYDDRADNNKNFQIEIQTILDNANDKQAAQALVQEKIRKKRDEDNQKYLEFLKSQKVLLEERLTDARFYYDRSRLQGKEDLIAKERLEVLGEAYGRVVNQIDGYTESIKNATDAVSGLNDITEEVVTYNFGIDWMAETDDLGKFSDGMLKLADIMKINQLAFAKFDDMSPLPTDEEIQAALDSMQEAFDKFNDIQTQDTFIARLFGTDDESAKEIAVLLEQNVNQAMEFASSVTDVFQTIQQNRLNRMTQENDEQFQLFQEEQERELAAYDAGQQHQLDTFIGTQEEKAAFERHLALERIEEEKRLQDAQKALRKKQLAEENKVAKRIFMVDKANTIAQIGVQTALGVAQINANPAVNLDISQTLRTLLTALVIGTGAAQIATVGAQQYTPKTFQDGGTIVGASHSDGGVPFTVAGQAGFEAEGGEYIFSRSTVDRLGTGLLDAINFGGASPRLFADGGSVARKSMESVAMAQADMAEQIGDTIALRITEIPVVNVAQETVDTSRLVENAAAMARL